MIFFQGGGVCKIQLSLDLVLEVGVKCLEFLDCMAKEQTEDLINSR